MTFAPSGAWAHEKLAFAHFDVEGSELDVLQGAREVIARDRPIFTAEVATGMTEYAEKLLEEIGLLGYEAYAFAEKCGENRDCRNLICLPKDRALPILSGVPLLASGSYLVNSSTMLNQKMSWQKLAAQSWPRAGGKVGALCRITRTTATLSARSRMWPLIGERLADTKLTLESSVVLALYY